LDGPIVAENAPGDRSQDPIRIAIPTSQSGAPVPGFLVAVMSTEPISASNRTRKVMWAFKASEEWCLL
jgi:hypothetical protein